MEKHRRIHRIKNSIIDIPSEVYTKEPKIIIIGFKELIIENYKSILKYEENDIKIETKIGNININGLNMSIVHIKEGYLKIKGKIISMDIEKNKERV